MQPEAARVLRQLIMGFRNTQLVYLAAKLDIADRVAAHPRTAAELAEEVNAHPDTLHRILRALAAIGILAETPDGKFRLDVVGELLRSNVPGSMRNVALLYGDDWLWRAYGHLLYSVRTGKPAFSATHGQDYYEFLDQHVEAREVFDAAMDDFSKIEAADILRAYSFENVSSIIDVGSGRGALLSAILQASPQLHGVAFDIASVEGECTRQFDNAGLRSRASFVAGDFFRDLPHGFDVYLLKSVLHNWDDDACGRILQVCRQAMSLTSRLLIIERVIFDDKESTEAKLFDINMLVTVGGRERTEREYSTLLASAGFNVTRLFPTGTPATVIEAALRLT